MKYTVIVPVYEQWHLIDDLLVCLEQQSIGADQFEVLLVDNGSKTFFRPERMPSGFRIIDCSKPGSYAARNQGIRQSRGEWLVFTDADCLPEPDWLEKIDRRVSLYHEGHCVIAGNIKVVANSEAPGIYEIYDLVKGIPQVHYVKQGYAATANLTFPRGLTELLGGFDECHFSGGDIDFCRRAIAAKAQLVFAEDATVGHRARCSWRDVATKARRIKGGHLGSGPFGRRLLSVGRTFLPPMNAILRFSRSRDFSVRFRALAIFVQLQIWGVEIYEVVRLLFRANAERR